MVVVGISASLAALSFFYRDHSLHYLGKMQCEPVQCLLSNSILFIAMSVPKRVSKYRFRMFMGWGVNQSQNAATADAEEGGGGVSKWMLTLGSGGVG